MSQQGFGGMWSDQAGVARSAGGGPLNKSINFKKHIFTNEIIPKPGSNYMDNWLNRM